MSQSAARTAMLERRAAVLAVAMSAALMVVKFAAWRITDSSAVYSDAVESIVNVAAGAFALWAVWHAHRPADATHPYGHGKFEFVSASVEGALIAAAAVSIVWHAAQRLLGAPHDLQHVDTGTVLIGVTVVVNGGMGAWLMVLGRRSRSAALAADGKHLLADALTSMAVIAALLAVKLTGAQWLDPVMALCMALAILVIGYRMVRRSFGDLVDEQDKEDYAVVSEILNSHVQGAPGARAPFVSGWHKLRTRHLGRHHWVDFHIQVPGDMDVSQAHSIASQIEHEIEVRLGSGASGGNATAHVEPAEEQRPATL